MKQLLPIGTIVKLNNATKSLCIIGILQIDKEEVLHDYIGVLYPEGYIDSETLFLFDHEDIAEIEFKGYAGEEYNSYMAEISLAEE